MDNIFHVSRLPYKNLNYLITCISILDFVEILGMFSLYHSFLVSFFPILRIVITLYIYSVHERMKELMKKLPFINLKMVSEPWNWNPRYFVAMLVRQRSTILRQALILISQPSNALIAIRLIPPVWISYNFKATTLGMTRKTMRNRGFEPWTFRSCLGYQHFVINDNNRDQRKKDSKKPRLQLLHK